MLSENLSARSLEPAQGGFQGFEPVCNPLPLAAPTLMKLSAKQLFRMIAVSFLQPSHPSQIVDWTENG